MELFFKRKVLSCWAFHQPWLPAAMRWPRHSRQNVGGGRVTGGW